MLWDVQTFFDMTQLFKVLERALELEFPLDLLCIFAMMHSRPKTLKVGRALSSPLLGLARSSEAGCTSSTRLARVITHHPIAQAMEAVYDQAEATA